MDRNEMEEKLSKKLGVDKKEAELILNEILAIRVVPNFYRKIAVERIAEISAVDKEKAELVINEFVGMVTSRPALFEEVVESFTQVAITNTCDNCRDCFNCGKEAFSQLITQIAGTRS